MRAGTPYHNKKGARGELHLSQSTWRRLEWQILTVIAAAGIQSCEEQHKRYLKKQPEDVFLMLCGNFGWSQQQNASSSMYVLIDTSTGKVLHQIILKKACYWQLNGKIITISKDNYIGTSKGMEGEAFWWMLEDLPSFRSSICWGEYLFSMQNQGVIYPFLFQIGAQALGSYLSPLF